MTITKILGELLSSSHFQTDRAGLLGWIFHIPGLGFGCLELYVRLTDEEVKLSDNCGRGSEYTLR